MPRKASPAEFLLICLKSMCASGEEKTFQIYYTHQPGPSVKKQQEYFQGDLVSEITIITSVFPFSAVSEGERQEVFGMTAVL